MQVSALVALKFICLSPLLILATLQRYRRSAMRRGSTRFGFGIVVLSAVSRISLISDSRCRRQSHQRAREIDDLLDFR
jgi:hypothetical protein